MYFWCICGEEGDLHILLLQHLEGKRPLRIFLDSNTQSCLVLSLYLLFFFLWGRGGFIFSPKSLDTQPGCLYIWYVSVSCTVITAAGLSRHFLDLYFSVFFCFCFNSTLCCPLYLMGDIDKKQYMRSILYRETQKFIQNQFHLLISNSQSFPTHPTHFPPLLIWD